MANFNAFNFRIGSLIKTRRIQGFCEILVAMNTLDFIFLQEIRDMRQLSKARYPPVRLDSEILVIRDIWSSTNIMRENIFESSTDAFDSL